MTEYWNLSKVSGKAGEDPVKYIPSVGAAVPSEVAMKRARPLQYCVS